MAYWKASAYNVGDLGLIPVSGRSTGEGNGTPLQYSCLENPMDGEAWRTRVHGVAKSWTWLSNFTFTFTGLYSCLCKWSLDFSHKIELLIFSSREALQPQRPKWFSLENSKIGIELSPIRLDNYMRTFTEHPSGSDLALQWNQQEEIPPRTWQNYFAIWSS